jgi:hypothetical protein
MTTLRYLYLPLALKNYSSGSQPRSYLYRPLVMRE